MYSLGWIAKFDPKKVFRDNFNLKDLWNWYTAPRKACKSVAHLFDPHSIKLLGFDPHSIKIIGFDPHSIKLIGKILLLSPSNQADNVEAAWGRSTYAGSVSFDTTILRWLVYNLFYIFIYYFFFVNLLLSR